MLGRWLSLGSLSRIEGTLPTSHVAAANCHACLVHPSTPPMDDQRRASSVGSWNVCLQRPIRIGCEMRVSRHTIHCIPSVAPHRLHPLPLEGVQSHFHGGYKTRPTQCAGNERAG